MERVFLNGVLPSPKQTLKLCTETVLALLESGIRFLVEKREHQRHRRVEVTCADELSIVTAHAFTLGFS